MIKKLKFSLLIFMFVFFGLAGGANAADLNWSVDQTIDLTSPDIDLTIASGSGANSLIVNAGNIEVVVESGDVFTVTPASGGLTVTGSTTAIIDESCSGGISTVTLRGELGGGTVVITPTGTVCTSGSTGGSSGSRAKAKTVTPAVVTPTPTPLPPIYYENTVCSYNLGMATLKNGSKGEAVKELQRFLNATMNLGLVVDGALGPKTIAVMMKWQTENGLASDGLIGPMTKAKINGIAAVRCIDPITPPITPPVTLVAGSYNFGTDLVKEGSRGEACKAWQNFLNDKASAGLVADGNCGPKTMVAAKAWQTSVGLTADGFLGAMSRAKALAQ